jgi:hypothetical protein
MEYQEQRAIEALSHVQQLQDRGHTFESVTSIVATFPLNPVSEKNAYVEHLMDTIDKLRSEFASERSARVAAEAVLADRCRELIALREAHDLANQTVQVLENRLRKIEKDELARTLLTPPRSKWKLWG